MMIFKILKWVWGDLLVIIIGCLEVVVVVGIVIGFLGRCVYLVVGYVRVVRVIFCDGIVVLWWGIVGVLVKDIGEVCGGDVE